MDPSGSVDFENFRQTSYSKTLKSNDGLEFMLKYDGSDPSDIALLQAEDALAKYNVVNGNVTSGSGQFKFNHEDTLAILSTPRWK